MSASRSRREKRRNASRSAGMLRDPRTRNTTQERPAVSHSEQRRSNVKWRLFSATIVLVLSIFLGIFFTADAFYVRSVAVGGVEYLTKEEVFAFADIANMHVFWVDPAAIRDNLMRSTSIADAEITLSWPPNMVYIVVEEREPALVWEQAGTALWVDISGRMMAQRQNRPELMRVFADIPMEDGPIGTSNELDDDIVFGALQLQEMMPELTLLRYDPTRGLGFKNDNGWDIWFGVGTGMAEKIAIYQGIVENLLARGIQAGEVNIIDPDAPYYTVLFGR
ncbi:MAG: cell division protein FtsQ/DivIB [Aggregatilineales bacterium]